MTTDLTPTGTEPTRPSIEAATDLVRPERLMRRAGAARARSAGVAANATAAASRAVLTRLLNRMESDLLEVVDLDGTITRFGPDRARTGSSLGSLSAQIRIVDRRAWTAVATEGSIGLGRGWLEGWWTSDDPTTVVRVLIRNLRGLDEVRNRIEHVTGGVGDRIRRVMPRAGRQRNRVDIATHYDLGNDFFALFLDETMTYSSAVFEPGASLADASRAKYDRLLSKLAVGPGTDVLEIGTGWGGFALRAAAHRRCQVVTTTVSAEQKREAESRLRLAGLTDRVEVLGRDWRDLHGSYDRIVSIEMIEAVDWRDYERFFATIARCLKPDGLVGLQAICVPDQRYERTKNTEDFIRRFIFPGGYLPSIGSINEAISRATPLQLVDLEDLSHHYAETLRQWRDRFDDRVDEVKALGLDDRFRRLWRFYLAYCEAGFLERHCTVNQLVLAGPDWRPDGLALRPA